ISPPVWGPDANLITAGYVDANGHADRAAFEQDIYYGFVWVTSGNLASGIVANLPLPQVHRWIKPFALNPPLSSVFFGDYLAIWSDSITVTNTTCGVINPPVNSNVPTQWNATNIPAGGPSSPADAQSPELVLYIAAKQILSWKAASLMPGVM